MNKLGSLMKCFTFYLTYIQLKIEQSMYTTNSSIQWLRFVFPSTGVMYSSLKKNNLGRWRVIRISDKSNAAVSGLNHLVVEDDKFTKHKY